MVEKEEVIKFLKEFKKYSQDKFTFIQRKKNLLTLSYLGITIGEAKNIIYSLTYENYSAGPTKDMDNPGSKIWVFGAIIENMEVYIKLSADFNSGYAKCISFHIAKNKLVYPLKGSVKK